MSTILLLFCGLSGALALEIHSPAHCLYGCPAGSPSGNDLIIRPTHILSSNDLTKFSDWVAYRVTPDSIGRSQARNWRKDPILADHETLAPEDYRDANRVLGTDRGHQAPLASFSGTSYWPDTNLLSNITPQSAALNQGAWARLEAAVRALSHESGAVYVMTGPLYERAMPSLPTTDKAHMIPSAYWKIVAIAGDGQLLAAGFVMDQGTPRNATHCTKSAQLSDIESRTSLRFFHGLDAAPDVIVRFNHGDLMERLGCPLD